MERNYYLRIHSVYTFPKMFLPFGAWTKGVSQVGWSLSILCIKNHPHIIIQTHLVFLGPTSYLRSGSVVRKQFYSKQIQFHIFTLCIIPCFKMCPEKHHRKFHDKEILQKNTNKKNIYIPFTVSVDRKCVMLQRYLRLIRNV